jgi:hypothetical protein
VAGASIRPSLHESRQKVARAAIVLAVPLVLLLPSAARAQTDAAIGLGGGIAFYHPTDGEATDSTGFALVYRFGKPTGWRPAFGLNWFTTGFTAPIGGKQTPLGDLRVRPLMGGYTYGVRHGRLHASAGLVGGYAFNSFEVDDRARLAYQDARRTTLLRISASNSLAARAEVSVWYDVSARVGLQVVAGYIVARPSIAVIDEHARETRRLRADALKLQFGLAYGIF